MKEGGAHVLGCGADKVLSMGRAFGSVGDIYAEPPRALVRAHGRALGAPATLG